MTLIKKTTVPRHPVFGSLFDDFFNRDLMDWGPIAATNGTIPAVNIRETGDAFLVELAAPGMKRDDFKIELDHNRLTISSEQESRDEAEENGKYTRREFRYTAFSRSFNLPMTVDSEKIEAKYDNGVLFLTIPKREEAKERPPRLIEIS